MVALDNSGVGRGKSQVGAFLMLYCPGKKIKMCTSQRSLTLSSSILDGYMYLDRRDGGLSNVLKGSFVILYRKRIPHIDTSKIPSLHCWALLHMCSSNPLYMCNLTLFSELLDIGQVRNVHFGTAYYVIIEDSSIV